jgi:diadenosine tetraphosphatase ApaH/serine/threonine PP2A family protein phosphatase
MKAIISDIHANWEALQAVLQDAARHGARDVYCLGDLVGYGPNPRECLDLLQFLEFRVVLQGNHDQAVIGQTRGFNPHAEETLRWTKHELRTPLPDDESVERRRRFLCQLPFSYEEDDFLFVHGSPRDPLYEYIFPTDATDARKMGQIFVQVPRYCFVGHTHLPGIFTPDLHFYSMEELDGTWRLSDGKMICNVGSVGQPRDNDWRACYVLIDGDTIRFRRVSYDIIRTVEKIRAVPELSDAAWIEASQSEPVLWQRLQRRTPSPAPAPLPPSAELAKR